MDPKPSAPRELSRRTVLVAGAGTALGAAALAGCGDDGEGSAEPGGSVGTSTGSAGTDGGTGGLVELSEVPVGGAVSATGKDGEPLIVAQPTEGTVVAFSAICTHKGCTVAPEDDILKCPCHGSTYELATGKNTGGPAPEPLADVPVTVRDGVVTQT